MCGKRGELTDTFWSSKNRTLISTLFFVWSADQRFADRSKRNSRAESKSVYPAACEKEQRRNTGILHFVQDDDFKK